MAKDEKTGRRSQAWFGGGTFGFAHRSWMRSESVPTDNFDGRPVIGICNSWSELTPSNSHFRDLAQHVREGILEAGGVPMEFPVISTGETLTRPTGMFLRNLASMDVEETVRANPLDGVVLLMGCDKTTPALQHTKEKIMARIPYPETEHLPHEVQDVLRQANINIFLMWAHSVNTVDIIVQLGAAQFAKLELPRSIRELVTLLGARTNQADYEWVQHVAPSKAAGVTDEQRAALERHELTDAYFNPQELAALQLAAAVQAGPQVPDAIFDSARKHLSDRQLVELVGLVGYYWMLGRVATVFQVDLNVAQGTEIYDAGVQLAEHKLES